MQKGLLVWLLVLGLVMTVGAQDDGFPPVEELTVEVLAEYPHDTAAFTQGLLVGDEGLLYESTGRYGQSSVRAVDLETGDVLRKYDLPEEIFAEGLALFNERLYQLTWRAQVAVVYDLETGLADATFEPLGVLQYQGEGWGLCNDDEYLYMSNGSNAITVRDPETFSVVAQYRVSLHGAFVDQLNELECVGDDIYANIWQSDTIIRFDKTDGIVNAVIDASSLLTDEERAPLESGAVLNGIAYDAENDLFYVTGKLWPKLFAVQFVNAE